MFWTFNLSFDILATVLATFPNIGQIFVKFSGRSAQIFFSCLQFTAKSQICEFDSTLQNNNFAILCMLDERTKALAYFARVSMTKE
jgi:hypothetical protein